MPLTGDLTWLGWELLGVAFGATLIVIGVTALLLPAVHRSARSLSLTSFGVIMVLYGLRLVAGFPLFRSVAPGSALGWDYLIAVATYLLPMLAMIFAEEFFGPGHRASVRRAWQVQLVYAVVAIAIDVVSAQPLAAVGPNPFFTIIWMMVVLINLFTGGFQVDREIRIVRSGLVLLVVLIIHDNLVGLELLPWTAEIEVIGVVVIVGCLGYAFVLRAFGNERRLATLDHELRTARQVQQSLLPTELPRPQGADLAARYFPMAAVGGDLYDCVQVDEHRFGVLVADVSGHGIPAALIASMVKTAAAAQRHVAHDPSQFLAGINARLVGQLDGHFVTAAYLYLDLERGRLLHASAGHPPPVLHAPGRPDIEELGESGLILGFVEKAEFPTTERTLTGGERLVVYTDGVVEAASPSGEFFDLPRLADLVRDPATQTAAGLADHVLDRLTAWTGKPELTLDDDLTLVVVHIADHLHGVSGGTGAHDTTVHTE